MFYKNPFSTFSHIRLLDQTISPDHQTQNETKPLNVDSAKLTN